MFSLSCQIRNNPSDLIVLVATHLCVVVWLLAMLFLWNDAMIEGQIILKWYAFVGGVVVLTVVSVCRKNQLKFAVY